MSELAFVTGWYCNACRTSKAGVLHSFCPSCGSFNTCEFRDVPAPSLRLVPQSKAIPDKPPRGAPTAPDGASQATPSLDTEDPDALVMEERTCTVLSDVEDDDFHKFSSGLWTIDKVLDGGLVEGGVVVIAGEKGVGKTTLTTNLAMKHVLLDPTARVFLASGEESLGRFRVRARHRLHYSKKECDKAFARIAGCRLRNIEAVHAEAEKFKPTLVIYDSMPKKFVHPDITTKAAITHAPAVMDEIVDFHSAFGSAALVVGRLTQDGKVQGGEDWLYDVDGAVLRLQRVYHPRTVKTRYVKVTVDKNRFGAEDHIGWLCKGKRGLLCVNAPPFARRANFHLGDESWHDAASDRRGHANEGRPQSSGPRRAKT